MWLSELSAGLQRVAPVRAHAWVAGQVPSWGCARGNHILIFLSLSPSFPLTLKINLKNLFKNVSERWLLTLNNRFKWQVRNYSVQPPMPKRITLIVLNYLFF